MGSHLWSFLTLVNNLINKHLTKTGVGVGEDGKEGGLRDEGY